MVTHIIDSVRDMQSEITRAERDLATRKKSSRKRARRRSTADDDDEDVADVAVEDAGGTAPESEAEV